MGMTLNEIRRAAKTLEDVFTPDGTAVVIASRTSIVKGVRGVRVTGGGCHHDVWMPLTWLTASKRS